MGNGSKLSYCLQLHAAILDKNYDLPSHFAPSLRELLDGIFEYKPKRVSSVCVARGFRSRI
eukprot:m.16828 g.16828  ORF g.16828 m.16828 type:complete len:61 (+) comp10613_c0_seq4:167-349(+)